LQTGKDRWKMLKGGKKENEGGGEKGGREERI
jgi:hypothetical protein